MNQKIRTICLEGSDGSGKETQTRLLCEWLQSQKRNVESISFPRYDTFWGKMVRQYLKGEFGELDPRIASVLYALDRQSAASAIKRYILNDGIVIFDRYSDSNKAHQSARHKSAADRKDFMEWLSEMEFLQLGVVPSDFTFYLMVDVKTSQRLMDRRGRVKDIHEADENHLNDTVEVYKSLAVNCPCSHGVTIDCVKDGKLLSEQVIHAQIVNHLEGLMEIGRL